VAALDYLELPSLDSGDARPPTLDHRAKEVAGSTLRRVSHLEPLPTSELLANWCAVTLELAQRHDLPSVGSPMGGLAEKLATILYAGTPARPGQRGWDHEASVGRVQVKALWDLGRRPRRRLGKVGTEVDVLVAVVFDSAGAVSDVWEVERGALASLLGSSSSAVVRLPWVRRHGKRLELRRVAAAVAHLGLHMSDRPD
jgi:hypothetical protein